MVDEDKGNSDGDNFTLGLLAENGQTVKELKGHPVIVENGDTNLAESSGVVCRTYKRRKRMKVVQDGVVLGISAGQRMNQVW